MDRNHYQLDLAGLVGGPSGPARFGRERLKVRGRGVWLVWWTRSSASVDINVKYTLLHIIFVHKIFVGDKCRWMILLGGWKPRPWRCGDVVVVHRQYAVETMINVTEFKG